MKKVYPASALHRSVMLVCLLGSFAFAKAQCPHALPWTEDFNATQAVTFGASCSGVHGGWVKTTSATGATFARAAQADAGGTSPEIVVVGNQANGGVAETITMTSPAINTTSQTGFAVSWNQNIYLTNGGTSGSEALTISVLTSPDNSTWTTRYSAVVQTPDACNTSKASGSSFSVSGWASSNLYIRFQINGVLFKVCEWSIDNVSVQACVAPTFTSFSPPSACAGSGATVTINGSNFLNGGTSVSFNGTAATTVNFVSSTQVNAVLPAGATTGNISVTTCGGTKTSSLFTTPNFIINATPSFTPATVNACANGGQTAFVVNNPGGGSFGSVSGAAASGTTVNFSGTIGNYYLEGGSVAGTASSTFTNAGCSAALPITVSPAPLSLTASNNGPFCVGNALNLTGGGTGIFSYTWTGPGSTGTSGQVYHQNFNNLPTSGNPVWTDDVTIPGWYASYSGLTSGASTVTTGTGSLATVGLQNYGVAGTNALTDRALGVLPTALVSGTGTVYIGVKITNNTGATVDKVFISYQGETWKRNTTSRSMVFNYGINSASLTATGYTPATALDYAGIAGTAGAQDGNSPTFSLIRSATLTVSLPAGQSIWLRWQQTQTTNQEGLAIDDLTAILYTSTGNILAAPSATVTSGATYSSGLLTSDVYTIPAAAAANAGIYTFTAFPDGANTCAQTKTTTVSNGTTSAPTVSVTLPTCTSANGSVAITSGTSGLTFTTDNTTYAAYTAPFVVAATAAYSIKAKNTSAGCISSATTGTMGAQPAVPSAPGANPSQTFCSSATVANLATTSGTSIQWYAGPSTTPTLTSGTALVNGSHYYATQNNGTCESNGRTDVTVTIYNGNVAVAGSLTQPATHCDLTNNVTINSNVNASAPGNAVLSAIAWYVTPPSGSATLIAGQTGQSLSSYGPLNIAGNWLFERRVSTNCNAGVQSASITVVVGTSPTVTAGNGGPYVIGQTIALTSNTNSGTAPYGYAWTGPQAFTPNNTAGPSITNATVGMDGTYTIVVTDAHGCTATDQTDVTVIAITDYTWTGNSGIDNHWNTATNWSPNGIPTGCTNNVTIPVTSVRPAITTAATIGNVTMASGAQISAFADLSVCGDWTGGNGSISVVGGSGTVILQGTGTHVLSGNNSFNELKLNNTGGGVTMNGASIDIYNALDLQKGNFNTTGGTLTFKSVSTSHVGIIDNFSYGATPGTITGSIYAERYYDAANTYVDQHMMGSPVNNAPFSQFGASGTAGFVLPTGNCDEQHTAIGSPYSTVFSYHEDHGNGCGTAQWKAEVSGNTQNGVGYSVSRPGAGTVTVNGTPNLNSSYTVPALANHGWSATSLQGHAQSAGWQLVSNPYLASLEITTSNGDIEDQVQVWNSNGLYRGTYQPGVVGSSAFIAPFQAFMIHKTSTTGTVGYTINASDRVRTLHTFFSQNANELKVIAENTTTNLLDQTIVSFNPNATDHFDTHYDADKFAGSLTRHTIYTLNDNKWMAINTLHSITETCAVYMGFEPGSTGAYTFNFDGVNTFDPSSYITLEDKALNVTHDARSGAYNFSADSADNWNRFVLHFTAPVQITSIEAGCNTQGIINVVQPGIAQWNYVIADDNSNIISSGVVDQNNAISLNANAGNYTLTCTDNTGYSFAKSIQVDGAQAAVASFTVSANTLPEMQNLVVGCTRPNAANYQWDLGNGVTATGQSVTTNYATAGIYNIVLVVTNQYGCSASSTQTVTVTHNTATGVTDLANDKISIWSSENNVFVDFTQIQKVDATISILNVIGQAVYTDKVTTNTIYSKAIDNIEAAYLMVQVKNADMLITKKVLIVNSK